MSSSSKDFSGTTVGLRALNLATSGSTAASFKVILFESFREKATSSFAALGIVLLIAPEAFLASKDY